MDTSKENTEMCRKADEIQKLSPTTDDFTRRPISISKEGNWFYIQATGKIGYKSIWLPRQDQLQDMIGDYFYTIHIIIKCINNPEFDLRYNSWEQAWLAFVMHDKYGKHWDGTDWVVE